MPVRKPTWRPELSEGTTQAMLLDLPKYACLLFSPHIMYLIYAHEQATVALQLPVDEVVGNSLFMCLELSTHPCMHHASIVLLRSRELNPWPTQNPVTTQDL